jgi:hypothetical protein
MRGRRPAGPARAPWLGTSLGLVAGIAAAEPQGSNRADYAIEVTADTATRELKGSETLRWTNGCDVATQELWFHLYWNAFANTRSTHLGGGRGGGEGRGGARGEDDEGWGWQRVRSIRCGESELLSRATYEHPDDDNADDRTVLRVPLDRPVAPGESIEVEIEWDALIPRLRRRTGYKGDFLFIAQWFPKLGVFEGARGWNCHQFHASTEFFADYGTYDVTIDLPAEYEGRVGASGALAEPPRRLGDRVRTRFLAPSAVDRERVDATGRRPLVHDFAWTADPDFKPRKRTFHYDEWKNRFESEVERVRRALGPEKELRLRNVEVTVLMQPEREPQWERHYEATCTALFFYGLWFGEYPYSSITAVDPAWGGGAAGGMEYPTLFTCGTRLWTKPEMHTPEGVTIHECGHQFWYGLVGNNEFEAAWMDEGFNSYTDSEALVRRYGPQRASTSYSNVPLFGVAPAPAFGTGELAAALSARSIPLPFLGWSLAPLRSAGPIDWWRDQPALTFVEQWSDPRWNDRHGYLSDPERDAVDTPAFRYVDSRSYRTNSYPRTAVVLRSLPAVVGDEAFLRGMRAYSERWRYRHPYPQDFFDTFCEAAGVDVRWYFDELLRGTGTLDWSVSVEQRAARKPRGLFQAAPGDEFVAPARKKAESAAEPEAAPPASAEAGGGETKPSGPRGADRQEAWEAKVLVARAGTLRLPLAIELRFTDGTSERRVWSREEQERARWLRIELAGERKLSAVLLDPDRRYYLDADMSNNRWFAESDAVAPLRWTERAFQRFAQLLHWLAGIGG